MGCKWCKNSGLVTCFPFFQLPDKATWPQLIAPEIEHLPKLPRVFASFILQTKWPAPRPQKCVQIPKITSCQRRFFWSGVVFRPISWCSVRGIPEGHVLINKHYPNQFSYIDMSNCLEHHKRHLLKHGKIETSTFFWGILDFSFEKSPNPKVSAAAFAELHNIHQHCWHAGVFSKWSHSLFGKDPKNKATGRTNNSPPKTRKLKYITIENQWLENVISYWNSQGTCNFCWQIILYPSSHHHASVKRETWAYYLE